MRKHTCISFYTCTHAYALEYPVKCFVFPCKYGAIRNHFLVILLSINLVSTWFLLHSSAITHLKKTWKYFSCINQLPIQTVLPLSVVQCLYRMMEWWNPRLLQSSCVPHHLYIPSLIFFLGISGHIFAIRVATAILSLKQLKVILPSSSCMNWKLSPFTKEELGGGSFNTVYMCICTLHIQTLAS